MDRNFYNASGCPDPTAYAAIGKLQKQQRKEAERNVNALIKALKATIADSGFVLVNRIELKDPKSGIVFK